MLRTGWGVLAMVLAGAMTCAAYGVPRESVTFTNQVSNAPAPGGGSAPNQFHTFTGGYPVRFIVVNATLSHIAAGTFGLEAIIQVITGGGQIFVLNPLQVAGFTGTASAENLIYPVPIDIPDAAGGWTFRFLETYEDAAGDDANWDTITFTLNDGAPATTDLGTLGQAGRARVMARSLGAGQIDWYRITLADNVSTSAGTFLDIDTQGSDLINGALHYNDTEIGLYDASGRPIADDDDSGGNANGSLPSRWSQLTFGAGTRPATFGSQPYDGRHGPLPAGTYYLSVSGFNTDFGPGWGVASASAYAGTTQVNIRTNTGAPRAKDLGELSRDPIRLRNVPLAPGEIRWYRFDVADTVAGGLATWLDIDTEGSSLTPSNDTEIGLYTASGNRVADDDDDGNGFRSQLSFGAGTRPGVGGEPYDGRDGPLPAGTYYLAVVGYNAAFGNTGWAVTPDPTNSGAFALNIRTNTGDAATCPADLDDGSGTGIPDGGITIDDLLYFLGHYEGGC